jgi:LysR family glycine cleavage system transcriptional activator
MPGSDPRPHLHALAHLEAVVRTGSIPAAAGELGVSPGAVAKQMAALERRLGCALFLRVQRRLVPTEAALRARAEMHQALLAAERAWAALADPAPSPALRVLSPVSFGVRWLLPRLPRYHAVHPGLGVAIQNTNVGDDWRRLPFDLAVRRDAAGAQGLRLHALHRERCTLMGAPALLERLRPAAGRALTELPWIDSATRPGMLDAWLRRVGLRRTQLAGLRTYPRYYTALEAALNGEGVLIGSVTVLRALLEEGRLAAPFPHVLTWGDSYVVATTDDAVRRAPTEAFLAWLRAELRMMAGWPPPPK